MLGVWCRQWARPKVGENYIKPSLAPLSGYISVIAKEKGKLLMGRNVPGMVLVMPIKYHQAMLPWQHVLVRCLKTYIWPTVAWTQEFRC